MHQNAFGNLVVLHKSGNSSHYEKWRRSLYIYGVNIQ
jgi:hypothetical protein